MSDLSGLELRKAACEAFGWYVKINRRTRPHSWERTQPSPTGPLVIAGYSSEESCCERLPAIESDPAVSEPMFLEWLSSEGLHAEMTIRSDGEACLEIKRFQNGGLTTRRVTMQFGSTPSEARARAILAASRKDGDG